MATLSASATSAIVQLRNNTLSLSTMTPYGWTSVIDFNGETDYPELLGWTLNGDSTRRSYSEGYLHIEDDDTSSSSAGCFFSLSDSTPTGFATFEAIVRIVEDAAHSTSNATFFRLRGSNNAASVSITSTGIALLADSDQFYEFDTTQKDNQIALERTNSTYVLYLNGEQILTDTGETDSIAGTEVAFGNAPTNKTSHSAWETIRYAERELIALEGFGATGVYETARVDSTAYARTPSTPIVFDWLTFEESASVTVSIDLTEEIEFTDGSQTDLGSAYVDLTVSSTEGEREGFYADEFELRSWTFDRSLSAFLDVECVGMLEVLVAPIDTPDKFNMIKRRSISMEEYTELDNRGLPKPQ